MAKLTFEEGLNDTFFIVDADLNSYGTIFFDRGLNKYFLDTRMSTICYSIEELLKITKKMETLNNGKANV